MVITNNLLWGGDYDGEEIWWNLSTLLEILFT